jgi:hypothetical protein
MGNSKSESVVIEELVKYLDERLAILTRRTKDPHCIDRDQQLARLTEVEAIAVRLSALRMDK